MLSISKLLLLVVVVGAVWYGWRWVQRVEAVGRDRLRRRDAGPAPGGHAHGEPERPRAAAHGAEDMEKCPECGAYVAPRSAVSCGRPGCPYGR